MSSLIRYWGGLGDPGPVVLGDNLAAVPTFVPQARGKVSEIINGAIVHYRDDLDLQNLIDFGQKEVTGGGLEGQGFPPVDEDVSPFLGQA